MMKKNLHKGRKTFGWFLCCVLAAFVGVLGRVFWLQVVAAEGILKKMEPMFTTVQSKFTPRGSIVDRNGEELAVSIMTGSLIADPEKMEDEKEDIPKYGKRDTRRLSADLLAPILKKSPQKLYEIFTGGGRFAYLARTMEPKDKAAVEKIIRDNHLPGLYFQSESKRYYTKKRMAAQILGFVGLDDEGLSGIEHELNKELKGKVTEKSKINYFINVALSGDPSRYVEEEIKTPTVYLTLDSKMQYVLEDAMDDAIARTNARGAAAIIMDPYTGEILGMASRPTFDPNNYDDYPQESWNNKAVSMIYEPGSVFKPIVGTMGLTEGIISPDTSFMDAGSIRIADRVIHNWDSEGMGWVPFSTIIKFSINTGMVQLGMELGAKRMIDYAKRYGLGTATGIDLPGEEDGILYNADDMYDPDIATMAIGQGIAVTPIQMLRAICAIANGGELVKPYIIKKIIDADGKVVKEGQKTVVRNVITPQVAAQMREMMEKVVSEGGGKTAAIKGYRIAGKTGTAEKLAEGGGYAAGKYIASFVGFVPSDKPLYAMLVMLDTPQGAFYGSQVSAPIFRDTLQQILVAKGIQPSNKEGLPSFEEMNAVGSKAGKKTVAIPEVVTLPDGKIKLPDLKNVDMRLAAELLEKHKLRLKPYGSGSAYQQKPAPGTDVAPGTTVEVWFK